MTFVTAEELPINPNWQNFEGLVNEVLNYGFNDGPQVNRSRVKAWINEGLSQIAREVEAPEFQEVESFETEAGQPEYVLPEDFLRTQEIFYPELMTRLRPTDIQEFNSLGNREVQGPPIVYAVWKAKLWVFPTPMAAEELQHRYIRKPPTLEQETDVPLLNPDYWHLLIDYAVMRGYAAEDDLEFAQAFKNTYKEGLDAYATDVQKRNVDRPTVIEGTWAQTAYGSW